jgi:hypothetical protein
MPRPKIRPTHKKGDYLVLIYIRIQTLAVQMQLLPEAPTKATSAFACSTFARSRSKATFALA